MSLVTGEKSNFQYIIRLLNTNVSKYDRLGRADEELTDCFRSMASKRSCTP